MRGETWIKIGEDEACFHLEIAQAATERNMAIGPEENSFSLQDREHKGMILKDPVRWTRGFENYSLQRNKIYSSYKNRRRPHTCERENEEQNY